MRYNLTDNCGTGRADFYSACLAEFPHCRNIFKRHACLLCCVCKSFFKDFVAVLGNKRPCGFIFGNQIHNFFKACLYLVFLKLVKHNSFRNPFCIFFLILQSSIYDYIKYSVYLSSILQNFIKKLC